MNFKAAFREGLGPLQIFSLLRIFNGFSLLIYYTFVLSPNWKEFYSVMGYVDTAFVFYPRSWLFAIWDLDPLKLCLFVITYALIILYTLGLYTKWVMVLLLPLHIGFHLASPMIIHEPQQLTNLLLVMLFFLPIDECWAVTKKKDFMLPLVDKYQRLILVALLAYIGTYYFFAGLKKLPDPHWASGSAVGLLASWNFLAHENLFNVLLRLKPVSFIFSWFTILFEICFLFIAFSSRRKILLPVGILFHAGISLSLDIGLFFWAMIQWYPLMLFSGPVRLFLKGNQKS